MCIWVLVSSTGVVQSEHHLYLSRLDSSLSITSGQEGQPGAYQVLFCAREDKIASVIK